ncbi:Uncharacterised protein [Mycobacteroides abscessus subsp. abscessus]|uniref:hypothetical protein n=1 Tax=Mycobacteroides abscessus TaxID=36809 RepID=UPI0009A655F7|nr:hypothetical protein [Mycobacteroides abscessus]SKD91763.1 Uncharacterised protein [Mycobacteroides abscessus subsp. abscessus]
MPTTAKTFPNVQMVANALDLCDTLAEASERLGVAVTTELGGTDPLIWVETGSGLVQISEYEVNGYVGIEIEYAR